MTREEAIHIVKTTKDWSELREALAVLVPELRESEDEQIRKEMIKYFAEIKSTVPLGSPNHFDGYIAYLEKDNGAEYDKNRDFIIYHPLKNGKGEYECISYSFYGSLTSFSEDKDLIDFLRTCFYTEEECNEWIEQQKEQKPTSFNEPYNPDEYEVVMEGNATSLKRKEQKPAEYPMTPSECFKPSEWSEEDEKMLHIILTDINYAQKNYSTSRLTPYDKKVSWLKALRPQSKQELQIKEGDKVSIHCRKDRKEDIITIYDGKVGEVIHVWDAKRNPWGHIVVRLDNGCNNGFYEDELEVLNEPKWKPSKEQIEAFEESLMSVAYTENKIILESLLEQLKKLCQ